MDDSLEALRRAAKTGDPQAALKLFWAEARANGPRTELNLPNYPYVVDGNMFIITPRDHNHIQLVTDRDMRVPLRVEALRRVEYFSNLRADYYYVDDEFGWQPFEFKQWVTAQTQWAANPLTWATQRISMKISGDVEPRNDGRIGDLSAPVGRRRDLEQRQPANSVRKVAVHNYLKSKITDWAREHARELKQASIIAANNRLRELYFRVTQLREQLTLSENQIASNIIYEENNS